MKNKYPGQCVDCGNRVAVGAGVAFKQGKRWAVAHAAGTCAPERARSFKEIHGHCEDAPCCGCCGQGQDYMSAEDVWMGGYDH